ncbi:MAG: ABC transporter ATP-binding protein [Candidatus Vecturithrix sp.]|jgi:ABC-type cobalamin/Fe3+-siderophores transport system ATPase subunit|nr:ABC transporter ATP-binding protein [Candidatus Vecturithrix sp.]
MIKEIVFEHVTFQYPHTDTVIFNDLSLTLTGGITTLVGQNGTGKTTFLLLAAGLLLPTSGRICVQGIDTAQLHDEEERQRYVSFIFQNMEFDTEESIRTLLHVVQNKGFRQTKDEGLIELLIQELELESVLDRKTQEISKGEIQRIILAFSLLYGSRIIMMDEPIFALEESQKQRVMDFITRFVKQEELSLYYAVHDLNISQTYSEYALLFNTHGSIHYGLSSNLLTREQLEAAYEIPLVFLKQKEFLHRGLLNIDYQKHRFN